MTGETEQPRIRAMTVSVGMAETWWTEVFKDALSCLLDEDVKSEAEVARRVKLARAVADAALVEIEDRWGKAE